MIDKKIDDITIEDIQRLLDNKVEESRTLEYKRELDGGKYGSSEFLADFIAFANSSGGDLIIGVEEGIGSDKGKPVSMSGIPIKNADADGLALNSTIRDKISPRFMDFQVKYIGLGNGNYIVVIRIKQSWNKPHMINGASRDFFVRNTSGKHAMDISEIKSSIFATRTGKEQLAEFRNNRLYGIMSNTINDIALTEAPRIVVHLIPFASFSEDAPIIPISAMETYWNVHQSSPIQNRINFDGKFILIDDGQAQGYIQLFRNGMIEYAKAVNIYDVQNISSGAYVKAFSPEEFEEVILRINSFLQYLSDNAIDVPISLSISLIGFKGIGYSLKSPIRQLGRTVDRNLINLPEIIISDYSAELVGLMKENLNIISNAFGVADIGWRGLLGWVQI